MASGFQNIGKIPELRKRIFYTITLLAVYRIGAFVTTPGVNRSIMAKIVNQASGTFLGMFNMFSGGALEQMSIFALGIMPYISASIILQLLTVVVPKLEQVQKEGEMGRRRINQYTRYGCVILSLIQSFFIAKWLEGNNRAYAQFGQVVIDPGWTFRLITMISLTTGTAFIMWLGEQITERGIGNGISLIIFINIIGRLPNDIVRMIDAVRAGSTSLFLVLFGLAILVAVIAGVVLLTQGTRKIPVQYAKRMVGRRMYGGASTHIPLKVNTAGVIPIIFASSIMILPLTVASFFPPGSPGQDFISRWISPGRIPYELLYFLIIVFFTYFYTAVVLNPQDVAENMRKYGGFVPGIRPGKKTAEYIDRVLTRITPPGAIALGLIAVLPDALLSGLNMPFRFGGTSILIVVGVALDTLSQIESHLLMRHYEGFVKKGRIRGRRA